MSEIKVKEIKVSKYSASGNDFVIFHSLVSKDRSELALRVCDRFSGVGADGLIVLLGDSKLDFKWEFYNSDGSVAEMCGNGSRAAFVYAYENGFIGKKGKFLSQAGAIGGEICEVNAKKFIVEVELTKPKMLAKSFKEHGFEWHFYDTGVPHLVTFSGVSKFDIDVARELRHKFDANVNFAEISGDKILVRTYERGVEAETGACGTGMSACFYAGVKHKNLPPKMAVYPTSGEKLELSLNGELPLFKGEVLHSFDAIFYDENLK